MSVRLPDRAEISMAVDDIGAAVPTRNTRRKTEMPPVCSVVCVDEETVGRLKPRAQRLRGHGPLLRALADDQRLMICDALTDSELCVCDIAALLDATPAAASYHLRLLYNLGLVRYRRAGKLVYYSLRDQETTTTISGLISLVLREEAIAR
jgi:ArsR family transcriptional regulator, lead/cadmium/zinc/bismuth-responsive transcriptional repressor